MRAVIHTLRQQMGRSGKGRPNFALADFVAPRDSGVADHIGAFVVTAGRGLERKAKEYEADHDDYASILVKALGDRLAEAFAEHMHERVRRELWGYAADEALSNEELIAEKYRGIRPAPGYPACPDHTEKRTLFDLLEARERLDITLTESFAMSPMASVCGIYFAHPESRYFGLGRISPRPGEGLCAAQGRGHRRRRALAGAPSRLRARRHRRRGRQRRLTARRQSDDRRLESCPTTGASDISGGGRESVRQSLGPGRIAAFTHLGSFQPTRSSIACGSGEQRLASQASTSVTRTSRRSPPGVPRLAVISPSISCQRPPVIPLGLDRYDIHGETCPNPRPSGVPAERPCRQRPAPAPQRLPDRQGGSSSPFQR